MNISDYGLVDREHSAPSRRLDKLVERHPKKAERLLGALEEFHRRDTAHATLVADDKTKNQEVYLVPNRSRLKNVPDAAALVLTDHENETIELAGLYENYGGSGEPAEWTQALSDAQEVLRKWP